MPKEFRYSRRRLLETLGAGAASAPFLGYLPLMESDAEAQTIPRRIMFFITGNGTWREEWKPGGGDGSLTLGGRILQPLERHRARLCVVGGLDQKVFAMGPGEDHTRAVPQCLTMMPATGAKVTDSGGPSIDQIIAKAASSGTAFASVHLGVGATRAYSFSGSNAPLHPQVSPTAAMDTLFGGRAPMGGGGVGGMTPAAAGPSRFSQRQKVFDFVRPRLAALGKRVGAADRQRIESHLQGLNELQQQLADLEKKLGSTPSGASATRPAPITIPARSDWSSFAAYQHAVTPHGKIAAAALATDLTRVVVLGLGSSGNVGLNLGFVGASYDAHAVAHESWNPQKTSEGKREATVAIEVWHAQRFAELLDALAGYPEGSGSLLDNTMVVWVSSLATGNHLTSNMPVVIAGGGAGKIRTNRYVSYQGRSMGELYVSLAQAMGANINQFGHSSQGQGALSGLAS
jgi:hypothetical protein